MTLPEEARRAVRRRDETILTLIDRIARQRDLDETEQRIMRRALEDLNKREVWRWSEREDRMLKALIRRRSKIGNPKPFERNEDIQRIAEELGRSYWAVQRRIQRLRKPRESSIGRKRKGWRSNCSDAGARAKG